MFFICLLLNTFTHATVINEYYQKIESSGAHIGYAIIREEFLSEKNQFIITSFIKTNDAGGSITESLKAYATAEKSDPISYQYTLLVGKKTKTIDAVVRKNVLYGTIVENKAKKTLQTKFDKEKDTFFSSFLGQKLLKRGLTQGKNYNYDAVAEEDGQISKGKIEIIEQKNDTYKILNDFKQNRFYSYMTPKGVIMETDNPITKIKTKWVATKKEAVGEIPYPESILKTLFGTIPEVSKK
ncbi:MAG: hypothetical protein KDD37_04130 [Bdellovibrionales bacterium]|nr:hypothetical protein [Bdellovibrionales bacterium]